MKLSDKKFASRRIANARKQLVSYAGCATRSSGYYRAGKAMSFQVGDYCSCRVSSARNLGIRVPRSLEATNGKA